MGKYKINSVSDNGVFVVTESFIKLCNTFISLKDTRGKVIHVIGAPGTGKSANIYAALEELGLNIYDVESPIKDVTISSREVFNGVYREIKEYIGAGSKEEVYKGLSSYDAILFADRFHDSHLMDKNTVGFSVWTTNTGFKAINFYLICISEYLKERNAFKSINIILQTAWRFNFRGKKYDIFSDLGIISIFFVTLMRIFFDVVVISYSPQETFEIVKSHINTDDKLIERYIHEYGSKPRSICEALEKER
jgi:hypothetical protein